VGFALISIAVGMLLGTPAALLTAGVLLVFIGHVIDDAEVHAQGVRGLGWIRDYWRKQLAREDGAVIAGTTMPHPDQFIPCDVCTGLNAGDLCPVCHGEGWIPNPEYTNGNGPHPPIEIDPVTEQAAHDLADRRARRGDGRKQRETYGG
jgi:hypothetical protein